MDTNFSPIENYPFLSPYIFTEDSEKIEKHKKNTSLVSFLLKITLKNLYGNIKKLNKNFQTLLKSIYHLFFWLIRENEFKGG